MRLRKRSGIALVIVAATLVSTGYNACSQSYNLAKINTLDGSAQNAPPCEGSNCDNPSSEPPIEPPVLPPALVPQSQTITVNNALNKVDILVVDDNSGSMAFEQASMARRFDNFINQLVGLDWQLAITTTDVSSDAERKDGRLLQFVTPNFPDLQILNSSMDLQTSIDLFAATIQRPINEGSGLEQGIFATYRAMERSLIMGSPNSQLIRPEATLAVVVVTDADETGNAEKNKPQNLINLVKDVLGESKRFSFHSIIVRPGDSRCRSDRSEIVINGSKITNFNEGEGHKYAELSTLTGGLIGNVCESDYGSQLTQIGQAVADSVKTATLNCLPQDTNNDQVPDVTALDYLGNPIAIAEVNGLMVTFVSDLPIGINQINYACLQSSAGN